MVRVTRTALRTKKGGVRCGHVCVDDCGRGPGTVDVHSQPRPLPRTGEGSGRCERGRGRGREGGVLVGGDEHVEGAAVEAVALHGLAHTGAALVHHLLHMRRPLGELGGPAAQCSTDKHTHTRACTLGMKLQRKARNGTRGGSAGSKGPGGRARELGTSWAAWSWAR